MVSIETGVDRLVSLVSKEKKIELSDAAKQLNIDKTVIQEWADFLEDEGIIGVQYSLSKTFLIEKRLGKSEVRKKEKEYENKKEAFVRKVDAALKQLENETAGFESIKKQYNAVKDQIGDEIEAVKEEMEQLRHYETLKKSMDHDILKQKIEYQRSIEEIRSRLLGEEKRYAKLIGDIEDETRKIDAERSEFDDIKKEEEDLNKRIGALQEILESVRMRVVSQSKAVGVHEERLMTLRELADKLRQDLVEKRKREIEPMLKISDDQSQRIMRIQEDVVKKIKAGRSQMHQFEEQAHDISARFEKFFDRRAKTEKLIKELESTKLEMKESLNTLIRKAKTYDIAVKGADTSKHIRGLEGQMREFDSKKNTFVRKLEQLKSFIVGKDPIPDSYSKPDKKVAPKRVAKRPKKAAKRKPVRKKATKRKPAKKRRRR